MVTVVKKRAVLFQSQNQEQKKLNNLVLKSERVLFRARTVFPFNFFPDEIIIDESKVSIVTNLFLSSGQIRSVKYEEIYNVIIEYQPFFASLELLDRFFEKRPMRINYLRKNDAEHARRLIQGMMAVTKENIDINKLDMRELIEKLDILGEAKE
ncbi:hypothetical protein HYT02_04940 [Candidatus Gottesmanbacteria bacterium]|nr:hypothetical protein [Candidatus Gottesmanbacteria bacterium]